MQTQFQYIIDLAKQYHSYSQHEDLLLEAINNLSKNTIEEIFKEYGDPDKDFKPVNFLRAEVARQLLQAKPITEEFINDIKDQIRNKDVAYFKHYQEEFLQQFKEYEIFERDMFANWQKLWRIFYPFFYRGTIKETILNYLEQMARDLLTRLGLRDYDFHAVDFQGPTNFGSEYCWVALYPVTKESHKDSYQFFVRLSAMPEAGRMAGHSLKYREPNKLENVLSYEDVVKCLENIKESIIDLNKESRNYFKFAPGSQASEWNRFYHDNIIAINFSDFKLGDISNLKSWQEINEAAGLEPNNQSNQTWNLWLFKAANIGDVVFVTKGVNTCLGIGIIAGDYYFEDTGDRFNNRRKVKWITDKVYQYKPNTYKKYKNLFRPDTFSPTMAHDFILNEYIRLYPELETEFKDNGLQFSSTEKTDPVSVVEEPDIALEDAEEENALSVFGG